jgi:hypothetical protein
LLCSHIKLRGNRQRMAHIFCLATYPSMINDPRLSFWFYG